MLDTVVVQALSTAIAARIANSYGFDARDPVEQEFIQQLVKRAFVAQTAKVKPLVDAGRAFEAGRGRIKWSPKLREGPPADGGSGEDHEEVVPQGVRVRQRRH